MKFSATEIRPNVYHFSFETQYFFSSTMMRLQEFYESPFEEIKGQYFSHEKCMDTYAMNMHHNKFSYFTDWSGFNIPGDVVLDFYNKFKYDLWLKEKMLFDLVLLFRHGKLSGKNKGNFYIIATYKCREEASNVKHELSHAYWYLHPEAYAKEARELLSNRKVITSDFLRIATEKLKSMGYCDEVAEDELQAFLATSSKSYLIEKAMCGSQHRLSGKFKKLYETFDAEMRKQKVSKALQNF